MKNKPLLFGFLLLLPLLLTGCGKGPRIYSMPGTLPEVIGPSGQVMSNQVTPAQATSVKDLSQATLNTPKQIALLLPITGSLARSGQAIRNGFLSAYYYAKSQHGKVPDIKIYDTNKDSATNLYNKAVTDGADFVIGPLTKANVAELDNSQSSFSVPVLALNTLPNYQGRVVSNFFQFGLAPEDEVLQIAAKAYQDGGVNALVIAPKGVWGDNLVQLLSNNFEAYGGTVVDTLHYSAKSNLASQVATFLTADQSRKRSLKLRALFQRKMKYTVRRRQDFNVIFLIATPEVARQIRPLFKFYYAGSVPIYATSTLYTGALNKRANQDLNGVIFCDMPWVLSNENSLPDYLKYAQQKLQALWPNTRGQNKKLYALGVDSYNLAPFLNQATTFPGNGIFGATGELYLDQYQHIYRRLKWAKFAHGEPTLLSN